MEIRAYLSDPQGAGLVIVAGGAWAVIRFFLTRETPAKREPALTTHRVTSRDGVAAGRDVTISTRHGVDRLAAGAAGAGRRGAVLLAASLAGNRTTATNGGIAVGGSVSGNVTQGGGAPPTGQ